MRNLRGAAAGLALGFSAGAMGCTGEAPGQNPDATTTTIATEPTVEVMDYGDETKALLVNDAPLRFIYVPSDQVDSMEDIGAATADRNIELLLGEDPAFLDQVARDVGRLMRSRYTPETIEVVNTPVLDTDDGCFEYTDIRDVEAVREQARAFEDDEAVEIVIVDQPPCIGEVGGYADEKGAPIVTRLGQNSLTQVAVHEGLGHSAEQAHDLIVRCEEMDVRACSVPDRGYRYDPYSLMGPEVDISGVERRMMAPTLERLGLLEETEVLTDPAPGQYTLTLAENQDPNTPKMIRFTDDRASVSLEPSAGHCNRAATSVQTRIDRPEIGFDWTGSQLIMPDDGSTCLPDQTPGDLVYKNNEVDVYINGLTPTGAELVVLDRQT